MSTNQLPTLHYFNGRGRAEASRLLFSLAGVEFNDVRHPYPLPADSEIKGKATYKQLPFFVDGDFEVAQSLAIEHYIASKYNLAGDTLEDKAKVLSLSQAAIDIAMGIWSSDTEEKKLKFKNETLPMFLTAWVKILIDNGGQFFVGSKLSAADANVYYTLENLYAKNFKEVVDNFPELVKFKSTFEAIPSIATYLSKRPTDLLF
ncbi:hypothetical protein PPL_05344 [Heterostelium album PN500]|uniref:Glutathione S-transferase n=1 Tax=Heterostelium pallidum (strain ATCC 26659 / Pp 5 / PN500) TaxID=670386 RepID=D3B9X4_HETP5|nr:hypothetical protein PPL_05344 [Heterostelium album PN500]EFA81361.1 hypothetical protein PPL_05344 [Heterostelium album PN500]|eukprot:XP_020433479.1 hypothetical protein PPL_05344 [Heterostelium album PN500]